MLRGNANSQYQNDHLIILTIFGGINVVAKRQLARTIDPVCGCCWRLRRFPQVGITANRGAFGNVPKGMEKTKTFTAKNITNAEELEIEKVSVKGDSAFSEANNKCKPKLVLKAGQPCTVEVEFKPNREPKATYSGKLEAEFLVIALGKMKIETEPLTGENKT